MAACGSAADGVTLGLNSAKGAGRLSPPVAMLDPLPKSPEMPPLLTLALPPECMLGFVFELPEFVFELPDIEPATWFTGGVSPTLLIRGGFALELPEWRLGRAAFKLAPIPTFIEEPPVFILERPPDWAFGTLNCPLAGIVRDGDGSTGVPWACSKGARATGRSDGRSGNSGRFCCR